MGFFSQESTGISEPMPVATTFVHEHEGKSLLGGVARLDTLVTMVDAFNFLKDPPHLRAKRGGFLRFL